MKKILVTVLLFAGVLTGYSQQFTKNINKSNEDIENPKKKDNPKTWIARAELMREINAEPTSQLPNGGITEAQLPIFLKNEQPLETKKYAVDGDSMKSVVYNNKEIFFNSLGQVALLRTTKTEIENPLDKALEAYKKAKELGGDAKKLNEGFASLMQAFDNAARGEYFVGNYPKTLELFKKSLECSSEAKILDTATMYYIGMVAMRLNDYKTAEEYYTKAADNGYIQDGDIYGSIYSAIRSQGTKNDTVRAGEILVNAYKKYPTSLNILGNLINHYLGTGEDPKKILPILQDAQNASPTNASLFYVEGNLHVQLKDYENAIAAYNKAIAIDATIAEPYYYIGRVYSILGDNLANEANTKSGKEYDDLEAKAQVEYKKSIEYFEKAFEINPKEPAFADILKRTYFRLLASDPTMQEKYDKYKAISDSM